MADTTMRELSAQYVAYLLEGCPGYEGCMASVEDLTCRCNANDTHIEWVVQNRREAVARHDPPSSSAQSARVTIPASQVLKDHWPVEYSSNAWTTSGPRSGSIVLT